MFQSKQVAGMIAIHVLMLLGTATAWAGRGDVDPNYGDGGRLAIGSSVLLVLPDDRLVIAEGTGAGLRVRMVDATGKVVTDFGEGGVVQIDSSTAEQTFWPEAAALAPNGDMIFVGSSSDAEARALLRLGNDGQPVPSFGDRGDGFVELAFDTVTFAVGPDGEILLAERQLNADGSCEGAGHLRRLLANGQPDSAFGVDGHIEIPGLDICGGLSVLGVRPAGGFIIGRGDIVVAVDAAGALDPTFGMDGRLIIDEIAWPSAQLLPDGGLLIRGLWGVSPVANDTVFLKFDLNGQPDPDFGNGTGSMTVDLGTVLLGDSLGYESINQLVLEPDGEHMIAHFALQHANAGFVCRGIARLSIDGTPDAGFGRNGVTCLTADVALLAVQDDGAPLFRFADFGDIGSILYRLLPDNRPSPGFLSVAATTIVVGESDHKAIVAVERFAGRDGAVSVNFATASRPSRTCYHGPNCRILSATAGSDYKEASGRLDWASGDDGQRTVTVSIVNDHSAEYPEVFGVDFFETEGVVQLIAAGASIFIGNGGGTARPSDPTQRQDSSGGGGTVSWATLLALLGLLFHGRARASISASSGHGS